MTTIAQAAPRLELTGKLSGLRVALVHDWLTGMRGGERALEALCELFPTAPLWTLLCHPESVSPAICNRTVHTSWLQKLPWSKTHYRHYLPLYPLLAEMTQVSSRDADVVISSSHAVAKAMVSRRHGRPLHICHIHTPMRYAWDRFDDYFGPEQVGRLASRAFYAPIARMLQTYDRATVNRVDVFSTNSSFVAERVRRIYGREATVIYAPVEVESWGAVLRQPEDWYLVVSALVPYKRVQHAIAACAGLRRRLKIVGTGPELRKLQALAASLDCDVEFLGYVPDDELAGIYARGRALLFPGVEDLGIVPVEALAAGCPVIALAEGGVLDTLTPETAVLYRAPTVAGLQAAMLEFEQRDFDEDALKRRAQFFSRERFQQRFLAVLEDAVAGRSCGLGGGRA